MSDTASRRMNIFFSEQVFLVLEGLARRRGKSMSDVVRDAVALEKWVSDACEQGARILIERDGVVRELVLRWVNSASPALSAGAPCMQGSR